MYTQFTIEPHDSSQTTAGNKWVATFNFGADKINMLSSWITLWTKDLIHGDVVTVSVCVCVGCGGGSMYVLFSRTLSGRAGRSGGTQFLWQQASGETTVNQSMTAISRQWMRGGNIEDSEMRGRGERAAKRKGLTVQHLFTLEEVKYKQQLKSRHTSFDLPWLVISVVLAFYQRVIQAYWTCPIINSKTETRSR